VVEESADTIFSTGELTLEIQVANSSGFILMM
jgi:hypothetical protein